MWTLASNMTTEWTPRTCLRTQPQAPEPVQDASVMQVILEALAPFAEARRAVADALSRHVGPTRDGSP